MLWANVSPRQVIIQHKKMPQIEAMNREKIKNLCLMCEHKIYQPGEEVDMKNGGIMLRGGLKQKVKDVKVAQINDKMAKTAAIDKLKSRKNSRRTLISKRWLPSSNF